MNKAQWNSCNWSKSSWWWCDSDHDEPWTMFIYILKKTNEPTITLLLLVKLFVFKNASKELLFESLDRWAMYNVLICNKLWHLVWKYLTDSLLNRIPLVSFLYERGWRQNFVWGGFPGPEREVCWLYFLFLLFSLQLNLSNRLGYYFFIALRFECSNLAVAYHILK